MDGIRVHSMELVSQLIKVAIILHNLCIMYGDDGNDFILQRDPYTDDEENPPNPSSLLNNQQRQNRRNKILENFSK